jgi:nucleotide-binding universal stress UspA family protein
MNNIKTVLVPTDFSDPANNALAYAIAFAKETKSKIVLLHIYHIPMVSSRDSYDPPAEVVSRSLAGAEQQIKNLEQQFPGLQTVEYTTRLIPMNYPIEIPEIILSVQVDLIIMGSNGSSKLREFLLGSSTICVIEGARCPVLAIPDQAQYEGIHNIGLAYEQDRIEDMHVLYFLVSLARTFSAAIQVFHIYDQDHKPDSIAYNQNTEALNAYFGNIKHPYAEFFEEDIEGGLSTFVADNHIDILTIIPKRRTLFFRLFKSHPAKKIFVYSQVPLLAIPGK